MELDKRPRNVWLIVLLANIGAYLTAVIMEVYDGGHTVLDTLFWVASGYIWLFCISIFVSVIPTWLSGLKSRRRNWFGFGIPIALLLPIPYFIWHFYNCTGKFCNLADVMLIYLLVISAVLFTLFYLIGIYFRKWNIRFSQILLWIESVLVISALIFIGYYLRFDLLLSSIKTSQSMSIESAAKICNSLPDYSRRTSCWKEDIRMNPGVDVCSLAKTEISGECKDFSDLLARERAEAQKGTTQ